MGVVVDQLLAEANLGTPGVDWTLRDPINSVRDVATYASGTTTRVDHLAYDAFGNMKIHARAADLLFQFTVRMHDEKTGLLNNTNRWYDAAVGNWLSAAFPRYQRYSNRSVISSAVNVSTSENKRRIFSPIE